MLTITTRIAGEIRPDRLRCTDCNQRSLNRINDVTVNPTDGRAIVHYTCQHCGQNDTRTQIIERTPDGHLDWTLIGIARTHDSGAEHRSKLTFRRGHDLIGGDGTATDNDDRPIAHDCDRDSNQERDADPSDVSDKTQVGHARHDSVDVYIGRGHDKTDIITADDPGDNGWLGNPFALADYDRETAIEKYRDVFEQKLENDPEFRDAITDLQGKTLGCWCRRLDDDDPICHGDVIVEYLDTDTDTASTGVADDASDRDHVTDRTAALQHGDRVVVEATADMHPDVFPVDIIDATSNVVHTDPPDGIDAYPYFFRRDDDRAVLALVECMVTPVELYRV